MSFFRSFLPGLRNRCLLQQCCSLTAEAFRALRAVFDGSTKRWWRSLLCSWLKNFLLLYIWCMHVTSNVYVLHFCVSGAWIHVYVRAPFSLYIYIDSSLWRKFEFGCLIANHTNWNTTKIITIEPWRASLKLPRRSSR